MIEPPDNPRSERLVAACFLLTGLSGLALVGAFTFDVSGDQDGTINPSNGLPCYNTFKTFQTVQAENPAFYVNLGDTIYSDSKCKELPGGIGDDVHLTISFEAVKQ